MAAGEREGWVVRVVRERLRMAEEPVFLDLRPPFGTLSPAQASGLGCQASDSTATP